MRKREREKNKFQQRDRDRYVQGPHKEKCPYAQAGP